jgi:hypothetical protein
VLTVVSLTGGLLALPYASLGQMLPIGSLPGVERRTDLRFPPGSVLQDARYSTVIMSAELWAVITMPPAAAHTFLATSPVQVKGAEEKRYPDDEAGARTGLRGWHPDSARRFLTASAGPYQYHNAVWVLADFDRSDITTIYLYWELL